MDTNPTPSASESSLAPQPATQSEPALKLLNSPLLTPVAVLLAGVFIGGAILWNGANPTGDAGVAGAGAAGGVAAVNIKDADITGAPYIGDMNAPVTIAVWADYQCPFCKKFEQETLPQIITNYVDAGKVKVVFFDFAFLSEDSLVAAEYGRAVWKLYPEKYFAWRTAMYAAQDEEHGGFGDALSINKLSATLGLDAVKIAADVAANKSVYDAQIIADKEQAGKFGVQATPSFVIGTQVIAGAYPFATFKEAIDPLVK